MSQDSCPLGTKSDSDSRYQRQLMVDKIGKEGQQKLAAAHVVIVGVGGLGCPVASYLVGAGVGSDIGRITLIDHDVVSLTNLHRQILFTEADVGKLKVSCAKNQLKALNSQVKIDVISEALTANNCARHLAAADVVIDACDNFAISYLLSDYCLEYQKPLVSASVMQTHGYVGVYCFNSHAQQPCASMRAVFPNPPAVGADCNSVGVVGSVVGSIATIQASEVIKVILADACQLAGRLMYMDMWTYRQSIMDFNQADEPKIRAIIIAQADISVDDWVVDVRRLDELENKPKFSQQHLPLIELLAASEVKMASQSAHKEADIFSHAKGKRLVFTCASGQRALAAADIAIGAGYTDVAVWL